MRYIKKIGTAIAEAQIPPYRGRNFYTSNGYLPYTGTLPLSRLDVIDGAVVELPEPPPSAEWASKELFIGALYQLVDPSALTAVMSDAAALKDAVAGMALLTTDAAPGGQIDLLDSRVTQWLTLAGVTLEQVRAAMAELAAEEVRP